MEPLNGLRTVASFEATKGILVLLAGFGVLSLIHDNIQHVAEQMVYHLHLNPANHLPRVFLEAAANLSDARLLTLALLAGTYASLRLVEAYGLWHNRQWAEWLAVISGGIYVPIEVYELLQGITWPKVCAFAINLGIVIYLLRALWLRRRGNP